MSGTMNSMSVPPMWMAPKMMPVSAAAGNIPSDRRSAVKQKPRKKSSSATGASTQTSTATATSATVDSSTPSSSGRSSCSSIPSAIDQTVANAKKPNQETSVQPAAGAHAVGRRPNLPGAGGGSSSLASSSAEPISAKSCT